MLWENITQVFNRSGTLFKAILFLILMLLLISLLVACASPVAPTSAPTSIVMASPTVTSTTPVKTAKPQGDLVTAANSFGSENWLPWLDPGFANMHCIVYDMLVYWDHINEKFEPGLAESWEVSLDGLTTIYHLRKGVQFTDGWGELTSADIKYTLERQQTSPHGGKPQVVRRIASIDTPDQYTVIVRMKDPYYTFFVDLSMGNSGVSQGFVCKKYLETVGDDIASQKPVGSGPYKLVDYQLGSYYKFEANENSWRVVPEFKTLTVRLISETSTTVAALLNKEIDLAQGLPAEQLPALKNAGLAVESSSVGGYVLTISLGGMIIPEDKRYDPNYHNKDPWVDMKVRKAMSLAIDREAISKAIYAGFAKPIGVSLLIKDADKYQYQYDPAQAVQLLGEAGYPSGFSFNLISYATPGSPEIPRVIEALAGYWEQIGLNPKIQMTNYTTYTSQNYNPAKTAGNVSVGVLSIIADQLGKFELYLLPNVYVPFYQDAGSYAIYRDNPHGTIEERAALVMELNQYYYDNVCPIPIVMSGYCYAWNPARVAPFAHSESSHPAYWEYVRHAQPINTYRLFSPWPDR